ncbi:alpha/beta hydrolase [Mesorhizobium sp. M0088]|uniref:alpha/beta fold hydrolase n=1 Tax=Mesorhizobium sp. M0088 TaxID=2956873 RepID=UPI003337B446
MWHTSEGEGRDIVFIHGWTMDHRDEMRTYEPIFALRSGWRRHYIDLPGMGRSPARSDIASMDDMLAAVVDIIQLEVKDRRFVIAGTSAGGYLARGVLARLGGRIDGVLLRAPLIVARDDLRDVDPVEPLLADASVLEPIPSQERERLGDILMQTAPYVAALRAKVGSVVSPANAMADEPFLSKIRDAPERYAFSFDVDAVPAVPCPSLIVTGRHDSSVGYRDAWRLVDKFTRSTFVVLDRAEHGLPIDQQDVFAALVNEWLDRIDEFQSFRQ